MIVVALVDAGMLGLEGALVSLALVVGGFGSVISGVAITRLAGSSAYAAVSLGVPRHQIWEGG